MTDTRRLLRGLVGPVVLVVVAVGCSSSSPTSPQSDASPPTRGDEWRDSRVTHSGLGVLLLPITTDAKAAPPSAVPVWRDLYPKLAADGESQRLLQRLYAGVRVDCRVLDGDADFDEKGVEQARPERGPAVLLSLHARQPGQERTYDGEQAKALGYDRALYGVLSYGRVIRLSRGEPGLPDSAAAALDSVADDLEVLYLVTNDYLLRHAPGWQLNFRGGPGVSPDHVTKRQKNATDLRRELDRRVEEHLRRHAAGKHGAEKGTTP